MNRHIITSHAQCVVFLLDSLQSLACFLVSGGEVYSEIFEIGYSHDN